MRKPTSSRRRVPLFLLAEVQAPGPAAAAFEQLFCFNIFIYLRPGNFCLFLASFYDSGPSAQKCLL